MSSWQEMMQLLATLTCAIFSGAALYINLVEHPARMSCGIGLAVTEWIPSYKRATVMQATLAILGFIFAFIAWYMSANIWWLIGGLLFASVVPYTLMVVMPISKGILSHAIDKKSYSLHKLLKAWGRLHLIRSIVSIIALLIFLINAYR